LKIVVKYKNSFGLKCLVRSNYKIRNPELNIFEHSYCS